MSTWAATDLSRIVAADDLHVSPYRPDGVTCGTPTWIWCVAVDGDLYVRGYHGQQSRWYRSAIAQRAGRIHAAKAIHAVSFEPAAASVLDQVDAAYRVKYGSSRYLQPMLAPSARSATVKIMPRDADG